MDFFDIIKQLVSLGLSPLEIFTVIVAVKLYLKSEELDKLLHACLRDGNFPENKDK